MKIGQQIRFIVINKQVNSLYSLIADGQYRNTSLGRDTWKLLIGSKASLQLNCNKEGFNAASDKPVNSKARIGIIGNNENNSLDIFAESIFENFVELATFMTINASFESPVYTPPRESQKFNKGPGGRPGV